MISVNINYEQASLREVAEFQEIPEIKSAFELLATRP